jgi:hypothetical protein
MRMICRFITLVLCRSFKSDELNLDLQRVHEWVAANGLKLNPIIVISRCRVDIPPYTLLIGSCHFFSPSLID